MKRWLLFAALALGLYVLTCPSALASCVPGTSTMGCNTPRLVGMTHTTTPAGARFPDVSVYQGAVNWSAVKAWQVSHGWPPAGVFKMGEGGYGWDKYAAANAAALHKLGMVAIGYWFVRPIGCYAEGQQIVSEAQTLHVQTVVLDTEVKGIAGYAACLGAFVKSHGLTPVDYTSAGSWPGGANGGLPLWDATYGPSMVLSGLWTRTPVAWQFSSTASVPGIHGYSDISVDLGLLALASGRDQYESDLRAMWASESALGDSYASLSKNQCLQPYRRDICVTAGGHVSLFEQRVSYFEMAAAAVKAEFHL